MPASSPIPDRCCKRGIVLTCYVDGRKRFRAAPLDPEAHETPERSERLDADIEAPIPEPAPLPVRRRPQA